MGMATLHTMMARMELAQPATGDDISALHAAARGRLPEDYLLFLRSSNGAEGYVAGRGYVRLWSARDVIRFNEAYRVSEFLPDVVLFGSDAAAIGYGFDGGIIPRGRIRARGMHRTTQGKSPRPFPTSSGSAGESLRAGLPSSWTIDPPTGYVVMSSMRSTRSCSGSSKMIQRIAFSSPSRNIRSWPSSSAACYWTYERKPTA